MKLTFQTFRAIFTAVTVLLTTSSAFVFAQEPGQDRMESRLERLEAALDLSDAQVDEIRQIFDNSRAQAEKERELNSEDPRAMREAAIARRDFVDSQINTVLTDTQREQYVVFKKTAPAEEASDELTARLDLSEEQANQVFQILLNSREQMLAIRDKYDGDRRKMRREGREIREETDQKIEALLTDEQRGIYEEVKQERHNNRRKRFGSNQRGF